MTTIYPHFTSCTQNLQHTIPVSPEHMTFVYFLVCHVMCRCRYAEGASIITFCIGILYVSGCIELGGHFILQSEDEALQCLCLTETPVDAIHWLSCFLATVWSGFWPECDYVTFGSLLSQIRLTVVCNVRAPYLGGPCKILRRSITGKPLRGGVKHKRDSKIERFWTYRRLMNGARYGLGYN